MRSERLGEMRPSLIYLDNPAASNSRRFLCRTRPPPLEFLCVVAQLSEARREPMLDAALLIGFVLVYLYIAYERLTHRL